MTRKVDYLLTCEYMIDIRLFRSPVRALDIGVLCDKW